VIATFRFASLLLIALLAAPLVRDCCLPVPENRPCHQSKPADDLTCVSNQQAITEAKIAQEPQSAATESYDLPTAHGAGYMVSGRTLRVPDRMLSDPSPPPDLYLQTAALLI
jgi:hypothetical protein